MKTVSFVIPVYNPPLDLFRGLLDSLLNQSGVGIEIVAVNDGSTNGALHVLRECDAAHPGVFKIIDRENRGAGLSRNEGFLATTGDYVWFVDADDEVRPNCLAELVAAMEETGADQMILNSMVAKPGEVVPFPDRRDESVREIPKSFVFANMIRAPWRRILRRDFLARIGVSFCDANLGEDQPETARWTIESERLFYANKVWYRYNLVETSLSRAPISRLSTLRNALRVNAQLKDLALRYPAYREWLDFLSYTAARDSAYNATAVLKHMAKTGADPKAMDEYRAVREDFKAVLAELPAERSLVWLFDKGCRVGTADTETVLLPRIAALEASVGKLRHRAERAEAAAESFRAKAAAAVAARDAIRNSLSWRLTAPLRAVLRPFVRGH